MINEQQDEARAGAHARFGLHCRLGLRRFLHLASLGLDRPLFVVVAIFLAISAAVPVSLLDHGRVSCRANMAHLCREPSRYKGRSHDATPKPARNASGNDFSDQRFGSKPAINVGQFSPFHGNLRVRRRCRPRLRALLIRKTRRLALRAHPRAGLGADSVGLLAEGNVELGEQGWSIPRG